MYTAAFYEKEITPPLGCFIPGYAICRVGEDVRDRLYARAMVLALGEEKLAIISMDGCQINPRLRENICARVEAFTGIPASHVLIAYTHAHTGIPHYGYAGDGTEEGEEAVRNQGAYFEVFEKLIADTVILANKRLETCVLSYNMGEVQGISFCRNFYMKNGTPKTNPGRLNPDIIEPTAEPDYELPVLFVRDAEGAPRGALITYACHADCVGGSEYSGDYISELSCCLKKQYGEDFVTVFLNGTCGDINHIDVTKQSVAPDHYRMMGQKIAGEVVKTVAFSLPLSEEKLAADYREITVPRRRATEEKIAWAKNLLKEGDAADPYDAKTARLLLAHEENAPEEYVLPLMRFEIGEMQLFAFSCEIFSAYGKRVKAETGAEKRMVAAVCNVTYGYIPTPDLVFDTILGGRVGVNEVEVAAGDKMTDALIDMYRQRR